jgi:hypothetical protein
MRQMAGCGASGDDAARFLRELRQLRDGAGLGHAELAARSHFPYDSIRAAEVGPELPDLPVLSAFVRGCGGTTEEWEERWRSLTSSPSLPVPESRDAGRSDAATAGARIGTASQVGDSPDPSVIIAALSRVAEEMASPSVGTVPASPDVQPPPVVEPLPAAQSPSAAQLAGDPPSPEAAIRSDSGTFPSVPIPTANGKPAGWDPIRVSTAWPAIRDTPTVVEPASSTGPAGRTGTGVPWGTAPREEDPADAASSPTGTAGAAARARGAASGTARVRVAAPAASDGSGSGRSTFLTRVVVIAAVVLCVLAVLLAIFG